MTLQIRSASAAMPALLALFLLSACDADNNRRYGSTVPSGETSDPAPRQAGDIQAGEAAESTKSGPARVAAAPQAEPAPDAMTASAPRHQHPIQPGVVFGGERYPEIPWQGFQEVRERPLSTFSIDVDTASYVHVRRILRAGSLPPPDAVRVEEMLNYFDYRYRAPREAGEPFALSATLLPNPWDERTRLLHVGLQGYDLPPTARPPVNLVLLVDVSGSMRGPDRLDLAKRAFSRFLNRLAPDDRVAIAAFAGSARKVLEPTRAERAERIRDALDSLEAGGGTAGRDGLEIAYEMAERHREDGAVSRVILISDGDFNVGTSDPEAMRRFIARKRQSGTYLSVLTVGGGNVNDHIAQALAQDGNGQAAHLDSMLEAMKVLGDELEANLLPIADDVKIQVEFNPALVESYRLIGYETRALRDRDFRDDRVDAGEVGSGHQVTALYEVVPVGADFRPEPGLRYRHDDDEPKAEDAVRELMPPERLPEHASEYAYVQLRYKRPGQDRGREMALAVTPRDSVERLSDAPQDLRFAIAVAAFGQILGDRLDRRDYGYESVAELADGARGRDPLGLRAEFLQLVRLAESLDDTRR